MSSLFTSSSRTINGVRVKAVEGFPTIDADNEGNISGVEKYYIQTKDVPKFLQDGMFKPPLQVLENAFYPANLAMQYGTMMSNGVPLYSRRMRFAPVAELGKPGDPFNADGGAEGNATYAHMYEVTIEFGITFESEDDQGGDETDAGQITEHTISGGAIVETISPERVSMVDKDTNLRQPSDDNDEREHVDADFNPVSLNVLTGDVIGGSPDATEDTKQNLLQPLTFLVPIIEHNIRWRKHFPSPDWETIIENLGKINKRRLRKHFRHETTMGTEGRFADPLATAEANTLLFSGFGATEHYRLVMTNNGTDIARETEWQLEMNLSQRRYDDGGQIRGWNHYFNSKQQEWRLALKSKRDGRKQPLYMECDLDAVISAFQQ